ncbi:hypothetical protein GCM10025768_09650 [Microbacterium pseudoresistens]|uniref:Pimeloyl-ACP methyl ester carboxylesterase n=1 Tax=Microbacterium pseudoresistens TaxID=640634 RepID=A0A7Y9EVS0_9MICO|nr:alpha/beta hydrolase [Microbacterium pseudoresistens]NYD54868.1 pimeloyl-ACP methyl ester carboxylesterase [Microbacterium pseudoresistens]
MPFLEADGIRTRYEMVGDGPPLLMFSPGGFNASLENWTSFGRYKQLGFIDALSKEYTCIVFDRRESGQSGGRVERLSWSKYVAQVVGLLDGLGIGSVHTMGGCVGCTSAAQLAVEHPERVRSMVLFSPAGGVTYRAAQHQRFTHHLGWALEHGLEAVAELARSTTEGFTKDPRVGPWAPALRSDETFATDFARIPLESYVTIVSGTSRLLFDRDTVPGPEPEDLRLLDIPALIVPGEDLSHTRSAARYLQETLPDNQYWDVPVAEQTPEASTARVREFLSRQ